MKPVLNEEKLRKLIRINLAEEYINKHLAHLKVKKRVNFEPLLMEVYIDMPYYYADHPQTGPGFISKYLMTQLGKTVDIFQPDNLQQIVDFVSGKGPFPTSVFPFTDLGDMGFDIGLGDLTGAAGDYNLKDPLPAGTPMLRERLLKACAKASSNTGVYLPATYAIARAESVADNPKSMAFNLDEWYDYMVSGEGGIPARGKAEADKRMKKFINEFKSKGYTIDINKAKKDMAFGSAHSATASKSAWSIAFSIDPEHTINATAWGLFQVMGSAINVLSSPSYGGKPNDFFNNFMTKPYDTSVNMFTDYIAKRQDIKRLANSERWDQISVSYQGNTNVKYIAKLKVAAEELKRKYGEKK